ncbi:YezD family protein [Paenibacillus silvisoli]|uniref:YezD family protein n=1 Tax=Paenibacillus silvisoli TaxID=3110539 RepID=UPI0028037CD3|nr:YezD family protein [Paenibacillus silvisoli]
MAKPIVLDQEWLERIASQVNGLEYGSVLITVHDGRVVQIDRTERKRFDAASAKSQQPQRSDANNADKLKAVNG